MVMSGRFPRLQASRWCDFFQFDISWYLGYYILIFDNEFFISSEIHQNSMPEIEWKHWRTGPRIQLIQNPRYGRSVFLILDVQPFWICLDYVTMFKSEFQDVWGFVSMIEVEFGPAPSTVSCCILQALINTLDADLPAKPILRAVREERDFLYWFVLYVFSQNNLHYCSTLTCTLKD